MCVALGGRVAESITFNSVTSGMSFYVFGILLKFLTENEDLDNCVFNTKQCVILTFVLLIFVR